MLGLGWIFGQDEASVAIGDYAPNELVVELEKACEDTKDPKQGLELYDELWSKVSAARERSSRLKLEKELRGEAFESYDEQALNQGVIKWLKFAFCHQDVKKCPGIGMDWRKSGVAVARTFFGLKRAREELARAGFVAQLLILSLPEDEDEDDANGRQDDGQEDTASARRHMELQIYVAEVLAEIVQYAEFSVYMCSIAVLNFVCICLNQVPEAIDYAARVLSKLSDDESNLVILMEASVGSVLEYFFNTCNHKRYSEDGRGAATWRGSASTADDQLRQYNRDISALSDCARVLGTLIQFSHEVRVHLPTLIGVFWGAVDPSSRRARKPDAATDDVRLLAELARLLYWEFRRDTDNMEVLLNAAEDSSVDHVLETLARIWSRCVEMHMFLTDNGGEFARAVEAAAESDQELPTHLQLREYFLDSEDEQAYRKKCPIHPRELLSKIRYARMLLCYMNCALWILLPLPQIRWKMIDMGWKKLHYAFDLQDEVNLRTVLATVRFVVDMPHSLTCHDFLDFFADQLIIILDNELEVDHLVMGEGDIMLFLDALSVLALQRGMQLKLASHDLYNKLQLLLAQVEQKLVGASPEVLHAIEFAALRAAAQVAVHPAHRLSWIGPTVPYPDPELFGVALRRYLKQGNDSARTIASLLLTIQSEKFDGPVGEYEATFRSILTWWRANSTATYEATLSAQVNEEREGAPVPAEPASLQQQLELARRRRAEGRSLTFRAALQVTLPHPSILALSLFSRMALEPRFKRVIFDGALEPILGCVCAGLWAEAREAAAVIANLMWMPDLDQERLVCWLKLDSPASIALDAASVLLPIKVGSPRPVPLGKGMYKSIWGIEFLAGSCVMLHPDALCTDRVPGLLTTASPLDTWAVVGNEPSNQEPYQWYDPDKPNYRHFTITCWFFWPLHSSGPLRGLSQDPLLSRGQAVLISSKGRSEDDRVSQVYFDHDHRAQRRDGSTTPGTWTLVDNKKQRRPLETPELSTGWHMLSVVSSTSSNSDPKLQAKDKELDGTKFYLDGWSTTLKKVWIDNDFYIVGNDSSRGGRRPFGALADFRIYARTLPDAEIQAMRAARDPNRLPEPSAVVPDRIARRLAALDAAAVLALGLDVPDTAAECLRALGNLASLQSQRARIYQLCGRRLLQMLDSPYSMLQRQAARVLNALS